MKKTKTAALKRTVTSRIDKDARNIILNLKERRNALPRSFSKVVFFPFPVTLEETLPEKAITRNPGR
jgi:hypothetical protein